ncbi:MAG TPA: J domain-containing protein [Chitinophagaceae bacterium]|nr:J domain-containing protein [Chitinophagaceae bacterium]
MQLKDYFAILELPSSATLPEIRKAYRRLAQLYHPDKNPSDPASNIRFAEIKEAYEVLTSPRKREHYLQQRWFRQSTGKKNYQGAFSPASLLQQALELERYVSRLDAHRMDRKGLFDYLDRLLDPSTLEKLNSIRDESLNRQFVHSVLRSAQPLSKAELGQLAERVLRLEPLAFSKAELEEVMRRKQAVERWERSRIWVVLMAVLAICLLILLATS